MLHVNHDSFLKVWPNTSIVIAVNILGRRCICSISIDNHVCYSSDLSAQFTSMNCPTFGLGNQRMLTARNSAHSLSIFNKSQVLVTDRKLTIYRVPMSICCDYCMTSL